MLLLVVIFYFEEMVAVIAFVNYCKHNSFLTCLNKNISIIFSLPFCFVPESYLRIYIILIARFTESGGQPILQLPLLTHHLVRLCFTKDPLHVLRTSIGTERSFLGLQPIGLREFFYYENALILSS